MTDKPEFQLAPDADISEAELTRARIMLRSGEISNEDFGWLCGILDEAEEVPFHKMTAAQKRRYFAQKRQNDLFAKPKKVRMTRLAKAKALFAKPEYWTGNQTDVSP